MTSPQDTGGAPQPTENQPTASQATASQEGQAPVPPLEPAAIAAPPSGAPTLVQHRLRRTRIGGVWVGLALAAVVLLLLLVFILENGQRASISYFGAHGHLPFGVALLLAAVAGALLVTIPASGRIIQLRRTARRHRRLDAAHSTAPQATPAPQATGTPDGLPGNQA